MRHIVQSLLGLQGWEHNVILCLQPTMSISSWFTMVINITIIIITIVVVMITKAC